jgi:hypothetical protein
MSIQGKILVTAAAAALAVASGCASESDRTDTASAPPVSQSASTEQTDLHSVGAAPVPQSASTEQIDLHAAAAAVTSAPITAAESGWHEQVSAYAERLDADLNRSGRITHAVMRRSVKVYTACAPTLSRAGDPGRFAPVAPQVQRACARLAKAARLLEQAIAASGAGGIVVAGTPEQRRFDRALNGAFEAAGNAQYDLQRALEKAAAIEAELEA